MGAALPPLRAGPPARYAYERHRPEETTLYRLVQEELATFLAQVEAHTGSSVPEFIKDEFEAYLECGILAHGFLRLRCGACALEKLVAFSCKRRGFCPSCGARRMAETAARLVDRVIPRVAVRQWVLSFPIPLRVLFATHPELFTALLRIVHRVITGFLLKQAGLDLEHCPQCGGEFKIIAAIEAPAVIASILTHLGLPVRAPPRSPARSAPLIHAT